GVPPLPLAQGPAPQTSEADIALVRSAIDALHKGGGSKATSIAAGISDPAGRKLIEWLVLRTDGGGGGSARYLAFMTDNPSWPALPMFHRRVEAMLCAEGLKPAQAVGFFERSP